MAIRSQESHLAAWSCLLFSQRQDFLSRYLARFPIAPNQQVIMDMRDKVLSSVVAEDIHTSRNQVSYLDDVDFYWKNDQMDVDAIFGPGPDTPFSPTAFDDLERED